MNSLNVPDVLADIEERLVAKLQAIVLAHISEHKELQSLNAAVPVAKLIASFVPVWNNDLRNIFFLHPKVIEFNWITSKEELSPASFLAAVELAVTQYLSHVVGSWWLTVKNDHRTFKFHLWQNKDHRADEADESPRSSKISNLY